MNERVYKATEEKVEDILKEGINTNNLNLLYQLVDIQKDICEIERSDSMHYGNYDSYGARMRDSRGRYMGYGHLDKMYSEYGRYEEGKEQYNRGGNYNAKEDSIKSLEYMLESMVDFVKMLKQDAKSQEEVNLIKEYTRKISEM